MTSTASGRAIRSPATGFRPTASTRSPRASCSTTRTPNNSTAGVAPWQQNLAYAEHFNKDVFWNWVGKVDHNFSKNDRVFFRWGENERNEIRNTTAIRSGPGQNGQLPLIRSNRAVVGDWVHIFGAGTVFNLRSGYTYYLEWSHADANARLRLDGVLALPSLVSQLPSRPLGRDVPASSTSTSFVTPVARHVAEPQPELHRSSPTSR